MPDTRNKGAMTDKQAVEVLRALMGKSDGNCMQAELMPALRHAIARLEHRAPTGDLVSLEGVLDVLASESAFCDVAVEPIRALPRATSVDALSRGTLGGELEFKMSDGKTIFRITPEEALAALLAKVKK